MNADWKHQFRNRMEQYSEPAPEGLWDEIMTSVESEQKKSGTRLLYILSGIAAAAVLVLAVILPSDKATDTGNRQIAGLQASGDDDMGRIIETVLPPKPINSFQERVRTGVFTDTSKQSEPEDRVSPAIPDTDRPGPAEPAAEKPGHETSAEQADGASDGYNFTKDRPAERHGDWQDFVLAEASEKAGKSRKMSVNVFASGFPGGSENHTGYSDMVMTAAAATAFFAVVMMVMAAATAAATTRGAVDNADRIEAFFDFGDFETDHREHLRDVFLRDDCETAFGFRHAHAAVDQSARRLTHEVEVARDVKNLFHGRTNGPEFALFVHEHVVDFERTALRHAEGDDVAVHLHFLRPFHAFGQGERKRMSTVKNRLGRSGFGRKQFRKSRHDWIS